MKRYIILTLIKRKKAEVVILLTEKKCGQPKRQCKPKRRWFDPQSGHVPGLQALSPVGGTLEATTH